MNNLIISIFVFVFSIAAWCGSISISGAPKFTIRSENQQIQFQGEYKMTNSGSETALQVYPRIQIDRLSFQGQARSLASGESSVWKFNQVIPEKDLCIKKTSLCQQALGSVGFFVVKIEHFYQDINSYPFVIPQLIIVPSEGTQQAGSPAIETQLKVQQTSENTYLAEYEVHNKLHEDLDLALQAMLPAEVELLTPLSPLTLTEQSSLFGSFEFRNKTGLAGSQYFAYWVVQWQRKGVRDAQWSYAPFSIGPMVQNKTHSYLQSRFSQFLKINLFWIGFICFAVFGGLAILLYWEKPLRTDKKQ